MGFEVKEKRGKGIEREGLGRKIGTDHHLEWEDRHFVYHEFQVDIDHCVDENCSLLEIYRSSLIKHVRNARNTQSLMKSAP